MFAELALATAMVTLTVAIHAVGLCSVPRLLRLEESDEAQEKVHALSLRGFAATIISCAGRTSRRWGLALSLPVRQYWLHRRFARSDLFSTITYGAIGFSDASIAERRRLVTAIEGIYGIILIGWSTAFFVTQTARMRRTWIVLPSQLRKAR